jgi:hypothetical protein
MPFRFLPTKPQPDSAAVHRHCYNRGGYVRAANARPTKGTNVETKLKKPKSKPSPKPKRERRPSRAVEAHREELEAQLSPQEEETYMARLRAASERAANNVTDAAGESLEDD